MDKRTTGIIATIASALLCGCPGLFLCAFGGITAMGGGEMSLDNSVQALDPTVGYVLVCLSVIFMAIPIVVGFVTLRRGPAAVASVATPVTEPKPEPPQEDEPLPPAS